MDKYLSPKQIAQSLGLKTITIRRWIDKGLLKGYRIGTDLRIKQSDFEQFMKEREVKK